VAIKDGLGGRSREAEGLAGTGGGGKEGGGRWKEKSVGREKADNGGDPRSGILRS
jgi:hypothetical protein